jgi:hypothetical protein
MADQYVTGSQALHKQFQKFIYRPLSSSPKIFLRRNQRRTALRYTVLGTGSRAHVTPIHDVNQFFQGSGKAEIGITDIFSQWIHGMVRYRWQV